MLNSIRLPAFAREVTLSYIIIAVALSVRIAYFYTYYGTPFYAVPMWDAAEYNEMGANLAHGASHIAWPYRPPLYPVFLGIIYIIFGPGLFVPSLISMGLGCLNALLVQRIASQLFGETAGFLAGLMMALAGMMLLFDFELLPTTIEVSLLLLLMLELIKNGAGEGSTSRAGIWFGLGVLARPVLMPVFLLALLWLWYKQAGLKRILKFAMWGVIPLILTIFIHLLAGSGGVFVAAQGGINFYIGNSRSADGFTATFPGIGVGWGWDTVKGKAEVEVGRVLTPSEVDRYYWKKGINEVGEDPVRWLKLMLRKSLLFWNTKEISNNRDVYYSAGRYPLLGRLLWIGFPVVLPIAFAGLVMGWRDKSVRLIAFFILIYFLSVIPFFVNCRFRHPVTPFLFILASGAIGIVIKVTRREFGLRRSEIVPGVVALIIGIVLPRSIDSRIDPQKWDYGLFTEGNALEQLGQREAAEAMYLKALEVNPRAPYVNFALANLAKAKGDNWKAIDYLRSEINNNPTNGRAWNYLGSVWMDLGNDDEALYCFRRVLEIRAEIPEAAQSAAMILTRRAGAAVNRGDYTRALSDLREAALLQPGDRMMQERMKALEMQIGN